MTTHLPENNDVLEEYIMAVLEKYKPTESHPFIGGGGLTFNVCFCSPDVDLVQSLSGGSMS